MSQERVESVLHPVRDAAPETLLAARRFTEALSNLGRQAGQPCAWSYDASSNLFEISPGTGDIFGLSGDEPERLTFVTFLQHIHPDDRQELVESAQGALLRRLPAMSYRYRVLGKDGRARFVVGHAHCEFGRNGTLQFVYGAIMDVTEQERYRRRAKLANACLEAVSQSATVWWWKQDLTQSRIAQDALAKSEERYWLLFETNSDAIIQANPGFRILHANRAACRMFGKALEQLCELRTLDLVCPDDERLGHMVSERLRTGGATGELVMLRADGSTFDAEVSTSGFSNADGDGCYHLIIRDATERVQLRRRLEAVNEELASRVRERTLELESANGELKAFARSLAHDLRQPIAAARVFAIAVGNELAKGNAVEAGRHAEQVVVAARMMGEYVEAMLSLAHISQARLDVDEVDLSATANSLLDELQRQTPERRLVRDLQPGLCAEGDVTLLRMLLQNLLNNAWKFTSRKDEARISFGAKQSPDGEVVYCVRDNGAGFDMSRADKLFGSFQRLHDSADFPGTGVGLANAQRIVARHGGRIWAQAAPGVGAVFRFTLGQTTGPQCLLRPQ